MISFENHEASALEASALSASVLEASTTEAQGQDKDDHKAEYEELDASIDNTMAEADITADLTSHPLDDEEEEVEEEEKEDVENLGDAEGDGDGVDSVAEGPDSLASDGR